jgi:hypothetical protein
VRPLRRPDDPHRQLLHVPRLRDEHRLLLVLRVSETRLKTVTNVRAGSV